MNSFIFRRLLPALLALGLIAGCVTRQQIRQIVADSNAAILTRQLGADADLVQTAENQSSTNLLEDASARIDAFIAAHPDQKAAAAALRVRQAMMFLSAGELELARAAFSQADEANLHTPRDRTLKAISRELVWWFGASAAPFRSNPANREHDDYVQATNALVRLLEKQSNLSMLSEADPDVEGIRDYVAETRAWIGLRYSGALNRQQAATARAAFLDTLTNYVATLGAATNRIPCGCKCEQQNLPAAVTADLRRCFRARVVLGYAAEVRSQSFPQDPPRLPETMEWLVQQWR